MALVCGMLELIEGELYRW